MSEERIAEERIALANFSDEREAERAKGLLENRGIVVWLTVTEGAGDYGADYRELSTSEIKNLLQLSVLVEDMERALDLLRNLSLSDCQFLIECV